MSSINDNNAFVIKKTNVPPEGDLADRFYDIDMNLTVDIDYRGYIPEINGFAPFRGLTSIKNIINLLNRDINVIVDNKDIVKLRNSIIFYNEYFVPSELNVLGYKPAPAAFDRIEIKYIKLVGVMENYENTSNPFKNDILSDINNVGLLSENYDDAIDRYIKKKKKLDNSIKSSKFNNNGAKVEVIPLHNMICSNMPRVVEFFNYDPSYEDCEYID